MLVCSLATDHKCRIDFLMFDTGQFAVTSHHIPLLLKTGQEYQSLQMKTYPHFAHTEVYLTKYLSEFHTKITEKDTQFMSSTLFYNFIIFRVIEHMG